MSSIELISQGLALYSNCELFKSKFVHNYCSKSYFLFNCVLLNSIKCEDPEDLVDKCEILLDSTWETINTGHWRDVDIFWRQLYRAVCFLKSVSLHRLKKIKDALLSCDMGLIMGAPIGKELFIQNLADTLQSELVLSDYEKSFTPSCPKRCSARPLWLPNVKVIPVVDSPSLENFMQMVKNDTPFIMKSTIDHWPALKKWCPEYLSTNFGSRTVPIEIGSAYTSEKWSQKLVTLHEFIEKYVQNAADEIAYLAHYELFQHIPKLKEDMIPLDYCAVSEDNIITNCWFGPQGTVSPLHHDQYHNLFCQVHGYKRFILFDSKSDMYPHPHHLLANTSQIDVENPDAALEQFPDYKERTAWSVELGPGDVLYIPMFWWHHVRSLSTSFSVSFWWKK